MRTCIYIVGCLYVGLAATGFKKGGTKQEIWFKKLHALQGTWEMKTRKGAMYENWKLAGEKTMRGSSYKITGPDTLLLESVSLFWDKDGLYYVPTTENQNDRQPVTFTMSDADSNGVVFENRAHDFPKRIVYKLVSADSLHAYIDDGTAAKRSHYYYHRIK